MKIESELIPYHTTDLTGCRVLVFAPHPDDETFGCGGSLALHRQAGDPVKVVVLTNGAKGDSTSLIDPESYILLRQKETLNACRQLDIDDIEFWMYEDRELASVNAHTIKIRLSELFLSYKPDLIYVPSPLELHPDHRATAVFIQKAVRFCPWNASIAFYEISQGIIINTLVNISSVVNKKIAAIQAYQSQLQERPYRDVLLALNRFRTLTLDSDIPYAEGFFIVTTQVLRTKDILTLFETKISEFDIKETIEASQKESKDNDFSEMNQLITNHHDPIDIHNPPLVSVVIPTYNRLESLASAIKSVLAQTYENYEIIVVNDGGIDVSSVIKSFNSNKIRYFNHESNRGVSAARNTAIKAARGKYIAYLDDDDQYFPNHLQVLIEGLIDGAYKVAYSNSYEIRQKLIENNYVTLDEKIAHQNDFDKERLLICNYIPTLNIMHERDILDETGMFDEQLETHEDWDLWIRMSRKYLFKHIDQFTAMFFSSKEKWTYDRLRFLQTLQMVHHRYSHLVTNPQILTAQRQIQSQHFKIIEKLLKDKETHINNLKSIIETTQKKLDDVTISKDNHIKNLEAIIQAKTELIDSITTSKDQHIENLETIIKSKETQYEDQIQAKNDHINNLEIQIQVATESIKKLETSINEKDRLIDELQITLQSTQKDLKSLQTIIDHKNAEIHQLKQETDQLKQTADQFSRQISALDNTIRALSGELHVIKNSRVWRWAEVFRHLFYNRVLGNFPLVRKGFLTISKEGFRSGIIKTKQYVFKKQDPPIVPETDYEKWLKTHDVSPTELIQFCDDIRKFSYKPKISIVMPVYNVSPKWLIKAIESVRNQIYPYWELCIADDGSTDKKIHKTLSYYGKIDYRIKITYLKKNLGISGASNKALALATGEYVALLDHDDELTPNALFEYVRILNQRPDIDMFYSDEDKKEMDGRRVEPYLKCDFSLDLLLSTNYVCHFCMYRRSILNDIGGFRIGYEGSQDYDLVLRVIERTDPKRIVHVPKILYHWRKIPGSAAAVVDAKSYAFVSAKKALTDYLTRNHIDGHVEDGILTGTYRVRRTIKQKEKVSIIIPFRDQVHFLKNCIHSIFQKTDYPNYEIILVNNKSSCPETYQYLDEITSIDAIKLLSYDNEFNFSAINNYAVTYATGRYILLLNNDTEVISPGWLASMVEHAQRKEVGAVGAKLLYPDRSIQHAGVVMGIGIASHAFGHLPPHDNGYCGLVNLIRNYCAVTGACMMTRKEVYQELGGLDEKRLTIAYNDVDFCLKAIEKGYLVVYTPYAELYHHESVSRGNDNEAELHIKNPEKYARVIAEREYMATKWKKYIDNDPYYNPNLTRMRTDFGLA